ncbi:MAG TPA: serine hydrolase domain-containing protein [Myxococcota bacterium]
MTVEGTCDPRFQRVRDELAARIKNGEERGASIAVVERGELVVDLWGGEGWTRDTITNVWSITKTACALAVLVLADRKQIDLDLPVAKLWPEFGARGKQDITVKQILSHTSGVSGWDAPFSTEDMFDFERAEAKLAAQEPWWEPGVASGYHLLNYGHLVDALVRRAAQQSLGDFVRRELAHTDGGAGIDFHVGLADAEFKRVASLVPPPPNSVDLSKLPSDTPAFKTFSSPRMDIAVTQTPAWRRAGIGAAGGHGNARSVALLNSIVTSESKRLSRAMVQRIFEEQADGLDLVLFQPLRFGIGFGLPCAAVPHLPHLPHGRIAFWGGYGGSVVVNDVDRGITFAYVMDKMSGKIIGSTRATAYTQALYASLGVVTA